MPDDAPTATATPVPRGARHLPVLLAGAGLCAAAIALALIAGLVIARHPFAFDRTIIVAAHGAGPAWLREAALDVTAMGGVTVLTMVATGTVVLLIAERLRTTALLVAAATLSGSWVVTVLKTQFGRERPGIVDHLVAASGMSFPSGHAANSAVVYLTIAALVSQVVAQRAARNAAIALAVLLVGMIGATRVYLGVHWPSDVLAGWSFGTLWAIGWWQLARQARPLLAAGTHGTLADDQAAPALSRTARPGFPPAASGQGASTRPD